MLTWHGLMWYPGGRAELSQAGGAPAAEGHCGMFLILPLHADVARFDVEFADVTMLPLRTRWQS